MQYTIEARELTNESTHRPSNDGTPNRVTVEAEDVDQAISQFVVQSASELVSITRPPRCNESIATVKKADSVYLVRVYAA